VREFRELADDAGGRGAPGIGDPVALGADAAGSSENADRELLLSVFRGAAGLLFAKWGTSLLWLEAGGAGAAERDSHEYTGAAFRPCISVLTVSCSGMAPVWTGSHDVAGR